MPVEFLGAAIGFASGVGVSIFSASIGSHLQKRRERQRHREEAAFKVYMLLSDLDSRYFWVVSNELNGQPNPPEIATEVRSLAFQIADKLREADDIPHLEDILTVLMDEDAYATASDRANALSTVIDSIAKTVSPSYTRVIQGISAKNLRGFLKRPPDHRNNAPGLMDPVPQPDGRRD
jgi:hypothetical protein